MHCDDSWNVLGASFYSSIAEAKASADSAYAGITSNWLKYRELTDQESHEVERLRQTLHELESKFPIDGGPHAA